MHHLQGLCVAPSAGQTTASSSPRAVCGTKCRTDHRLIISKGCVWHRMPDRPPPHHLQGLCVWRRVLVRPPPHHLQGLCVALVPDRPSPHHLQGLCVEPSARQTTTSSSPRAVCGVSAGQTTASSSPRAVCDVSAGQTTASSSQRAVCGAECQTDQPLIISKGCVCGAEH